MKLGFKKLDQDKYQLSIDGLTTPEGVMSYALNEYLHKFLDNANACQELNIRTFRENGQETLVFVIDLGKAKYIITTPLQPEDKQI